MFTKDTYIKRREKLRKGINSGGILLFMGNNESPMNCPANYLHFRQDSSFLYFFGLDQPNLAAIIDLDEGKEIIFGDNVDIEDIIWMGNLPTMEERANKVGVDNVLPFADIFTFFKKALSLKRKIHFLPPYRADNKILLKELTQVDYAQQKEEASVEFIKSIVNVRSYKEEAEIAELQKAINIGADMHIHSMRRAKPGVLESQIAGEIEGIALAGGGMLSFPVILSQNGQILHNHDHSQILQEGRLMLTDAGAETAMHYASDHTRTVPVGGKFSQRQKEIYNLVYAANEKVIEISKPGLLYRDAHLESAKVIASGLIELGLMKGNVEEAVKAGAHALFFPHGLGHMLGLDVHDMEDLGENYVGYNDEITRSDQFGLAYLRLGRRLEKDFVITNEPGCYFIPALIDKWKAEKKFEEFINYDKVETYKDFGGIRIEDDLLITENGCEVMGKHVPKSVDEIENEMQ